MHACRLALILLLLPLFLVTGCSDDDDDECPTCPGDPGPPTMANIWPHADGNTWIHDLEFRGYDGDPDDQVDPEDPVPPVPGMEELHARLAEDVSFEPRGASEGLYRVSFDGNVTTDSGVTAQYVREELFLPEDRAKRVLPSHAERLRAVVLAARPDLRGPGADKDVGDELSAPILMGGYAFEATDEGIYSYGDISTNYTWIYLEGDLAVGDEFSMQLIPELADDIFLYGQIWSVGDHTVGGVTYADCVECFYVIDMGESAVTDEQGTLIAKARSYIYGLIHYAPGTGPVSCHERLHGLAGDLLAPEPIILEYVATLSGSEVAP